MSTITGKLRIALKATRQLGLRQLGWYAWYQVGLRTGVYRWRTPIRHTYEGPPLYHIKLFLPLPSRQAYAEILSPTCRQRLLEEANEIVRGQVRLFSGEPRPLRLAVPGRQGHWSFARLQPDNPHDPVESDVKLVWETGRFGWAITLARAFYLTGDENYARLFWSYTEAFAAANPPNQGLQWFSGQEVALRLIALSFALHLLVESRHTTSARLEKLTWYLAAHANRIPATISYARAQNNNHLLSEGAGLYTAAVLLPDHPSAGSWRDEGWHAVQQVLQSQLAEDGAYVQHSTNYHRLVLQLALWVRSLAALNGQPFPEKSLQRLAQGTRWLLNLLDPGSGRAPNLGPNDGAYVLPLCSCPFSDYRPVAECASRVFLGLSLFGRGAWDEMSLWLDADRPVPDRPVADRPGAARITLAKFAQAGPDFTLDHPDGNSWAYLRVAHFTSRPGHADQLHLDLWWNGLNIAQDAGTYLYNAPPPWNNTLSNATVHNTLTVDRRDQMTRAGRFLYLDWAQARLLSHLRAEDGSWESLSAEHSGYTSLGLLHRRQVTAERERRWIVKDEVLPASAQRPPALLPVRLHWLLPDWPWELSTPQPQTVELRLKSPFGWLTLQVKVEQPDGAIPAIQLVRAGELLHGEGAVRASWGWVSPTYAHLVPALSFAIETQGQYPLALTSIWSLPLDVLGNLNQIYADTQPARQECA